MELIQLQYFVAAAKSESLTKAADRLNITQSALSKSIIRLEQELGTALFNRSHRHLELTGAGTAFLEAAEKAIKDITEGVMIVQNGDTRDSARPLAIGASFSGMLPDLTETFFHDNPGIRIRSELLPFEQALNRVVSFDLDCAFVLDPGIPDNRLQWLPLLKEPLIGIARRGTIIPEEPGLAALEKIPVLLTGGGYEHELRFTQQCQTSGFFPRIVYNASEGSNPLRMLECFDGVLILPLCEAYRYIPLLEAENYSFLMPERLNCYREIGLVRRTHGGESERLIQFVAFCIRYFASRAKEYKTRLSEFTNPGKAIVPPGKAHV